MNVMTPVYFFLLWSEGDMSVMVWCCGVRDDAEAAGVLTGEAAGVHTGEAAGVLTGAGGGVGGRMTSGHF